ANSAKKPSPVFFTMRPRCSPIFGLTSCPRWALSLSCVPSSSTPIRREYPATSAARIAARRRTGGIVRPARVGLNQSYSETGGGPSAQVVDPGFSDDVEPGFVNISETKSTYKHGKDER